MAEKNKEDAFTQLINCNFYKTRKKYSKQVFDATERVLKYLLYPSSKLKNGSFLL